VKLGFTIILFLILGALVAHYVITDNGYSVIYFQGYEITMSVPVLLAVLLLLYLAIRVLVRVWRAPRQLGEYAADRRMRKAGERITRGYIELSQGNYARSEKLLTRGARHSETPLLNYLAAARAAQAMGDKQRRDNWLSMAYEQEPKAETAILLAQAELQYANHETEPAAQNLLKVLDSAPKNVAAMTMLAGIYIDAEDWPALEQLLPKLRKLARKPPEQLDAWTIRTWAALLSSVPAEVARSKSLIKQLPRPLRNIAPIIAAQAQGYMASDLGAEAEALLRRSIERQWNSELVRLYGLLDTPKSEKHLLRAESWLARHPDDPDLLLTAGRLCAKNKIWGKARSYFESSLSLRPAPETWHELGKLLTQMGEAESASEAYQQGLSLSYGMPEIPRLTADAGRSSD
jgi:HemY protein